jgi:hypothetical protein
MSSNPTITAILVRLEKDQVELFDKWKKKGSDEIDAIISAIRGEAPPQPPPKASESKRRIFQESKGITHLSEIEIKEIIRKESSRFVPRNPGDLKGSFKRAFLKQGKTPEEAERMADIAVANRRDSGIVIR